MTEKKKTEKRMTDLCITGHSPKRDALVCSSRHELQRVARYSRQPAYHIDALGVREKSANNSTPLRFIESNHGARSVCDESGAAPIQHIHQAVAAHRDERGLERRQARRLRCCCCHCGQQRTVWRATTFSLPHCLSCSPQQRANHQPLRNAQSRLLDDAGLLLCCVSPVLRAALPQDVAIRKHGASSGARESATFPADVRSYRSASV